MENENFFRKLEYRFLVERTKTENASFRYKTIISEANAKTNKMASTRWTYHKERSLVSNYVICLKICLKPHRRLVEFLAELNYILYN